MEPLLHVVITFVTLTLLGVKPCKAFPLAMLGIQGPEPYGGKGSR